jgi:seryl-tRNA synthetase
MGSVHSFVGNDRGHQALLQKKERGEDWTRDLWATEVMLTPAACYPLYPTARGTLPKAGRTVDLRSFVFRHEPSVDPARMQIFRQREFVRLGTPEQALAHRNDWLRRGEELLRAVGLNVRPVPANDPFFGRGGRMLAATQKEQELKYELVVPVASTDRPTAVASCNYHLNHFGHAFGIQTPDGKPAHTACIGFGLERVALALFRVHGFDPARWPADVQQVLEL